MDGRARRQGEGQQNAVFRAGCSYCNPELTTVMACPGPVQDWTSQQSVMEGEELTAEPLAAIELGGKVIVFSCELTGVPTRLCGIVLNPRSQRRPWLTPGGYKTKRHKKDINKKT